MSRIFRRPMFRGGSTNMNGIMSGIEDRKKYSEGSAREESARERLAKVAAEHPSQAIDPLSQFLIQGGLNLVSQPSTGGVFSDIASAAKEPTNELFKGLAQQGQLGKKLALEGEMIDIEGERQERIAKLKAQKESGYLREETAQRAYEDLVKTRTTELGELKTFEKPNANQKFARQTAEYDIIIKRNLRNSKNPDAQEINQNDYGLVPFDVKKQEFDFTNIVSGGYYYYPEEKVFVQRIPATDENPGGLFKINPYTFQRVKVPENNR